APLELHLMGDHRAHGWVSFSRLAERALAEGEDFLPAVDGLLLTVRSAVVVEEAVTRPVVAMELVRLAVLLQLGLVLVDLLGRGRLVLVAEESEERGREILRVVDGRYRLVRCELLLGLDHAAAPQVEDGIEALQPAAGEERLAAARAGAEHADLPADVGQRAQNRIRAIEVA